jgi:hypothetical protein
MSASTERKSSWIPWIFVGGMLVVVVVNGFMAFYAISTFTGLTTITLDFALSESTVDLSNAFWNTGYLGVNGWKIFDVSGTISGFENLTLAGSLVDRNDATLESSRSGASFFLYQGQDGIYLNYAIVPEPSTVFLAAAGALMAWRRKRG